MKIFVGGINGAGKTTICDLAAKELGIKHIKGSSLIMDYLGFPGDYEKLRAQSPEQQKVAWDMCAETILTNKDSFLLDRHYLSLNKGKINLRVGDWINKFDALILITAPIDDILGRIEKDLEKRDRALFSKNEEENEIKNLEEHQKSTREEFYRIVESSQKPAIEIINADGKGKEAVSGLVEFLRGI